jgi:hypothetical protein
VAAAFTAYGDAGRLGSLARRLGAAVRSEPLPEWAGFEAEALRLCPMARGHQVKDWWVAMGKTKPWVWKKWLNAVVVNHQKKT